MTQAVWRLILNGKTSGDEAVREAVMAMREQGQALQVRVTWEAGDAERLVHEAIADKVAVIIAGGGDGTLSEVAAAMAMSGKDADALPALALLPLGTANDFAAATGIAIEPEAALRLIAASTPQPIDLLRLRGDGAEHWCVNLASGGFGTDVTVETPEGMKKLLGGLAYLITGVTKLATIEPQTAHFTGPGLDWQGDFIALGLGNGRQAGGGQQLCPHALLDDGQLALTIVPPLADELLARLATLFSEGRQALLDEVAIQASLPWLEINSNQPLTLNLDGEPVSARHFRIDCIAGRVRMHLPADSGLLAGGDHNSGMSASSVG